MSGLVISGKEVEVPGLRVVNYKDDPTLRLKQGEDGVKRRAPAKGKVPRVQSIGHHTTGGIPGGKDLRRQSIIPGAGTGTDGGRRIVDQWNRDARCAGAHLVVDHDGVAYCLADLVDEETFHATTINAVSIGIENVQGHAHAELYEDQIHASIRLTLFLTALLGIQRQIPSVYRRRPHMRLAAGGADWYGVFGHRDQSDNRGEGDPGNYLMDCLATAGFERFDLDLQDDLAAWRRRQSWLGFEGPQVDGVPGPGTVKALKAAGFADGLWACPPAERADLPR